MHSTYDYPWYIISLGRIHTSDLVYGGCIFHVQKGEDLGANYSKQTAEVNPKNGGEK